MNYTAILLKKKTIYTCLDNRRLERALSQLKQLIPLVSDWHFHDKIHEIETSYHLLLSYFSSNQEDSMRMPVYSQLIDSCYKLTDQVVDKLALESSTSNLFLSKRRLYASSPQVLEHTIAEYKASVQDPSHTSIMLEELFDLVWTLANVDSRGFEEIEKLLAWPQLPKEDKLTLISALTLALNLQYSSAIVSYLLDLSSNKDREVALRASVGIVFAIEQWNNRILLAEKLQEKLRSRLTDPLFAKWIQNIQILLIRSKDTEKITKKFNEEILPEMIKMNRKMGNFLNLEKDESGESDFNPDWVDHIQGSDLEKKLQEVNDLQLEGADVMMSTFSNLKGFAFFEKTCNWFLPFKLEYLPTRELFEKESTLGKLVPFIGNSKLFCNSDKYSFLLSISKIPTEQQKSLAEQLDAQRRDLEEQTDAEISEVIMQDEIILNLYIRDVYRFFKLFRRKDEFIDIFGLPFHLFNKPILSNCFKDIKLLHLIADHYFNKTYYDDAQVVFEMIHAIEPSDIETLQKLGYIHQIRKEYAQAIEKYQKVEIITVDNPWTVRRMAQCYKSLGNHEKAIELFKRFIQIKGENSKILLQIAHSLLALEKYEEALHLYLKIDFSENKLHAAKVGSAWCYLILNKIEQSRNVYLELQQQSLLSGHDRINFGHTYLVVGNITLALQQYQLALSKGGVSFKELLKTLNDDALILHDLNVDELTLFLVKDILDKDNNDL